MKKFIETVYGQSNVSNVEYLKELKLKQVGFDYNMTSFKLRSNLLFIQSEEVQTKLIFLQNLEQINKAKQSQLNNAMNLYLQSIQDTKTMSAKQIARDALSELHRLQKL